MLKNDPLKTLIFFDGDCLFCNFWVHFLLKKDTKKQFYFAPLQSEYAKQYLAPTIGKKYEQLNTLYLYHQGKVYEKAQAVLKIALLLKGWFYFFYIFKLIPNAVLNFFYDLIAKHRHQLMKDRCVWVRDERMLG